MRKVNVDVRILWHTPDPARWIASAAKLCYKDADIPEIVEGMGEEEIDRRVEHILDSRHLSCLRHAVFHFGIQGVSRTYTHQQVRHNAGVDYEQQSQHYTTMRDWGCNAPPTVAKLLRRKARDMLEDDELALLEIYEGGMDSAKEYYNEAIRYGMPKEEARQLLPNACETRLVMTANLNAVFNMARQRTCFLNTPETLEVWQKIRLLVIGVMPILKRHLGPSCWTEGICWEGDRYFKKCGRPWGGRKDVVVWYPPFPRAIIYADGMETYKTVSGNKGLCKHLGKTKMLDKCDQQALAQAGKGGDGGDRKES